MKVNTMRRIGLAALAVLALTAFANAAPASAATGFIADNYNGGGATLSGTSGIGGAGGLGNSLTAAGVTVECVPPTFATTHTTLSETATTDWSAGEEGTCYGGSWTAPIDMNGCEFTADPGAGPSFTGTTSIGPPGCGPIKIVGFVTKSCTIEIDLSAAFNSSSTYSNQGSGTSAYVDMQLLSSEMTYKKTLCAGSNGTFKDGKWAPSWKVTAKNLSGQSVGLKVGDLPLGIYIDGEKSAEESKQPRFRAERYPRPIAGAQDAANPLKLALFARTVSCSSVAFNGFTIDSPLGYLAPQTQWGGCTSTGEQPAIFDMNSCRIVPSLANEGPPYTGTAAIVCEQEADQVEFGFWAKGTTEFKEGNRLCLVKLPAQTFGGSVSYSNQGTGVGRSIGISLATSGIDATRTGLCIFDGKGTSTATGELNGSLSLHGQI